MDKKKLKDFNSLNVSVEDMLNQAIPEILEEGKETFKKVSPDNPRTRSKRYGRKYKDTWETNYEKNEKLGTVYNSRNYRLTHLLENGHFIVNKKGGLGWSPAQPHYDKTFKTMENKADEALERGQIKVNFD